MEPDFWHERWQRNEIGFHEGKPNTYLTSHWRDLAPPKGSVVFVPLCGKAQDMIWLASQGHKVLGVELSEIAVQAFFEEIGGNPTVTKQGDLIHFSSSTVSIYCGNLFSIKASQLSNVAAIFDRGALVALPANMRQTYVAHLCSHLPQIVKGLLVTMEYDQPTMQGPPFSVPATEISKLYADFDEVSCVAAKDIEFRGKTVREYVWKYLRH